MTPWLACSLQASPRRSAPQATAALRAACWAEARLLQTMICSTARFQVSVSRLRKPPSCHPHCAPCQLVGILKSQCPVRILTTFRHYAADFGDFLPGSEGSDGPKRVSPQKLSSLHTLWRLRSARLDALRLNSALLLNSQSERLSLPT